MNLFLGVFLGIVGPAFLWMGKKRSDPRLLLAGLAMIIASYFFF